jgi:uncharacterized protein (TIGR02145 family)
LFSYQVIATDADGDQLTYSLIEKPNGFTINASSGLITAYPGNDLKGIHSITVEVSDNLGLYDTQPFNLQITIETSSITDPRDFINYATVRIGNQWWMAENLKATQYTNGVSIGTTNPATLDISGESAPKYQWAYDGNESNVSTYGRLYTWNAATDSRGICPSGWHLPSETEWNVLIAFLIDNKYNYDGSTSGNYIAKSLASTTGWRSFTTIGAVGNEDYPAKRNVTGFTSLPGGCKRDDNGLFDYMIWDGFWWSSISYDANQAWFFRIDAGVNYASFTVNKKWNGYSIRCIKD